MLKLVLVVVFETRPCGGLMIVGNGMVSWTVYITKFLGREIGFSPHL